MVLLDRVICFLFLVQILAGEYCVTSGPKFCVDWLWGILASGWGSLWEQSSFVLPWFSSYAYRNVSGAVPEWPWISGFRRNSWSSDREPKMQLSLPLNSLDSFFVTLHSIFSEVCVIVSFCDLGTFVICAKVFLGCFSWCSLLREASFRFFSELPYFAENN